MTYKSVTHSQKKEKLYKNIFIDKLYVNYSESTVISLKFCQLTGHACVGRCFHLQPTHVYYYYPRHIFLLFYLGAMIW